MSNMIGNEDEHYISVDDWSRHNDGFPLWVVNDEENDEYAFVEPNTETKAKKHKFALLDLDDLANQPEAEFLIDGIIYPEDMGILVAPSASGKTFVALDLAFACATGSEFANRFKVNKQLDVLYACGEGGSGINKRLLAAKEQFCHNKEEHGKVVTLKTVPNLCEKADVIKFIKEIQEQQFEPDFIIIDTLHTAIPGHDDSSNRDMGIMFQSTRLIRDTFKCVIMLVHHTGKNGEYRGASSLFGDVDFFIGIDGNKDASVKTLAFDKIKDAERPDGVKFELVAMRDSMVVHWLSDDATTYTQSQLWYFNNIVKVLKADQTRWFSLADVASNTQQSQTTKDAASHKVTIGRYLEKLHKDGFVSQTTQISQANKKPMNVYRFLKDAPLRDVTGKDSEL